MHIMNKPNLVDLTNLEKSADCLKVIAHPLRLRMIDILMQGEFSVGDIAEMCNLPPNQTCEHLRLMKGCGFLESTRKGRVVYYRIVNPRLPAILECIKKNCNLD